MKRITYAIIPHKTGIRLLGVARNPANGFPARPLGVANSQASSGDYDADNDGLIEVSSLEQLNAIRYDLNGDGRPDRNANAEAYASAFPDATDGIVCPGNYCSGYELTKSLDFRDRASYASGAINVKWTEGSGWLPIGIRSERFNATFDGNSHTISNLFINRTNDRNDPGSAGLFGAAGHIIRQASLANVSVTGRKGVGGLVGINSGNIIGSSYVTGSVSGKDMVGGLVGNNRGEIRTSYASGSVSGEGEGEGGAVFSLGDGGLRATVGTVSGGAVVGGLVGQNEGKGTTSMGTIYGSTPR